MGRTTAGTGTATDALSTLRLAAEALSRMPAMSTTCDGRDAWADVVRATQQLVNMATAVQDEAIVRLAAIEPFVTDDGEIEETHRAPGHVALDAAAIVSGALEVSAVHAEHRVRSAVRLAADGAPGTATCTGLGRLHDAMRAGVLDAYRAGVVAAELELAPPEVAETVVATLGDHLAHATGPQLRRRCRRLLAGISPDLLRQRAERARSDCRLRRWVAEPGVDQWEGTFPSEDAAAAWAAIDARAQQLVADGSCDRVDRARAQALIDLVMNSATVTTVITLAVPASPTEARAVAQALGTVDDGAQSPSRGRDTPEPTARAHQTAPGLIEVMSGRSIEPVLVPAAWLSDLLDNAEVVAPPRRRRQSTVQVETRRCAPLTGALTSSACSESYRPPDRMAALVRQRDGRCRFPGCSVAARFCDLDHVRPWPGGPTALANLMCLCRRHHRVKQRPGWSVRLDPDGTAAWTDPTGALRTTLPLDALHAVVLPGAPAGHGTSAAAHATNACPEDAPHSDLEFAFEHLLGHSPPARRRPRQRRQRADLRHGLPTPSGSARTFTVELGPGVRACGPRPVRRTSSTDDSEAPPF